MATLAAANVVAMLRGWPVWDREDMHPFLGEPAPHAAPNIVNAADLKLTVFGSDGQEPAKEGP